MKKVLLTATVQSHIAQFHTPLIKMLKLNGFEVHVAARNNLIEKNGLKIEGVDKLFDVPFDRSPLSKNNVSAYKELKKVLLEHNYNIIHCNTPMGGVITRLAAKKERKRGTKIYYTAHGFHYYKGAPLKNWIIYFPIEKWLAKYTDKLITITEEDYDFALRKFKKGVYHIHGVGANSYKYFPYSGKEKERIRNVFGYNQEDFLILCIGELNSNKNQFTAIKSINEVKKYKSNIRLLIAGNGPKENELKELVISLKLQDNVEFLGYRRDLDKYINISDVIISASYREGLPLNIMEAMMCGKPVITSKNRGHKELVKNEINGYLLDSNDYVGFSEKILKLYLDSDLREELGKSGKKNVEPFKVENVINELSIIYDLEQKTEIEKLDKTVKN